jgi:hypothetical protein
MKRMTDTQILELISSGRMDEGEAASGEESTLSTEDRRRCDTLRQVWVALGDWKLRERETDLWPSIEAAVRRVEGRMDPGEYAKRSNGALKEMWRVLDEWHVPETHRDLWPDIAEAVATEPAPEPPAKKGRLKRMLAAVGSVFARVFRPRG